MDGRRMAARTALPNALRRVLHTCLDLLLPRGCAGCDKPDAVLCDECRALFAHSHVRELDDGPSGRVWAAAAYQGRARHAVLAWKDHDDTELDTVFARCMTALLRESALPSLCAARTVMVIPAPSSAASIRRRGRKHILPLARAVAAELRRQGCNARACEALASNTSAQRSVQQISSAHCARRIGGHIRVKDGVIPPRTAVILVDDIITTGSTLRQCARTLHEVRATVLGALVLASAMSHGESDAVEI